jgi:hypothetical protein
MADTGRPVVFQPGATCPTGYLCIPGREPIKLPDVQGTPEDTSEPAPPMFINEDYVYKNQFPIAFQGAGSAGGYWHPSYEYTLDYFPTDIYPQYTSYPDPAIHDYASGTAYTNAMERFMWEQMYPRSDKDSPMWDALYGPLDTPGRVEDYKYPIKTGNPIFPDY